MSNLLADINSQCGEDNAPGIEQDIFVIRSEDVESIPAVTANTLIVASDIVLKATKSWSKFKVSRNEQEFKTTIEGDEDSNSKNAELKFFLAGVDAAKSIILSSNSSACPLIVLFSDKKGQYRIMGKLNDGAYLSADEQLTPKNGYVVTVKSSAAHFPYFYTGAIPS